MPQGEGAKVLPANAGIEIIQEIWGAAKEFYTTMNAWAQSTAKYQAEVEKLQHQMGASATQAGQFGQGMLERSQALLQSPSTLVDVFGKVGALDLDKGVEKSDLAKRTNAQEVTKTIAQIAYIRGIPAGDLAGVVTPLLRPVQANIAEVRVRLAQFYNVTNDAPLPEALMKSSFAPVVNRLEQFGVAPEQSIGSAASLLEIAKLRASDLAQAVKATEELFAQFNDADVRKVIQEEHAAENQARINRKQEPIPLTSEVIREYMNSNQRVMAEAIRTQPPEPGTTETQFIYFPNSNGERAQIKYKVRPELMEKGQVGLARALAEQRYWDIRVAPSDSKYPIPYFDPNPPKRYSGEQASLIEKPSNFIFKGDPVAPQTPVVLAMAPLALPTVGGPAPFARPPSLARRARLPPINWHGQPMSSGRRKWRRLRRRSGLPSWCGRKSRTTRVGPGTGGSPQKRRRCAG